MLLGATAPLVIAAVVAYAGWFYWEFGAPPLVAGSTPPRVRWCGGGEAFTPTGETRAADALPASVRWQSSATAWPYSWKATAPATPTEFSGEACPMQIFLAVGQGVYEVYARSGGP